MKGAITPLLATSRGSHRPSLTWLDGVEFGRRFIPGLDFLDALRRRKGCWDELGHDLLDILRGSLQAIQRSVGGHDLVTRRGRRKTCVSVKTIDVRMLLTIPRIVYHMATMMFAAI